MTCFSIFVPPEENFDWHQGWGWGGATNHPKSQNITKKQFVRNIYSFSKICSYMQKTTPNPINALKITIYNTKHSINTKVHWTNSKLPISSIFKHFKTTFINQNFIFHIFYMFVYFVTFVAFTRVATNHKKKKQFVRTMFTLLHIFPKCKQLKNMIIYTDSDKRIETNRL